MKVDVHSCLETEQITTNAENINRKVYRVGNEMKD